MPAVSPIVHARSAQVGIGERESRRYWGQQLVVRGQLHSPMGKLVMRAAHVAPIRARCFNSKRTSFHVALELEHMESVDLRSEIRKADAVLPVFARAGQRSDTLKRVARRGGCRLLFRLGVQRIGRRSCLRLSTRRARPDRASSRKITFTSPYAPVNGMPRKLTHERCLGHRRSSQSEELTTNGRRPSEGRVRRPLNPQIARAHGRSSPLHPMPLLKACLKIQLKRGF